MVVKYLVKLSRFAHWMATEAVELGKNSRKNHTVWVHWFLSRVLSKTLKERDELRLKTTLVKAEKENHKAFGS